MENRIWTRNLLLKNLSFVVNIRIIFMECFPNWPPQINLTCIDVRTLTVTRNAENTTDNFSQILSIFQILTHYEIRNIDYFQSLSAFSTLYYNYYNNWHTNSHCDLHIWFFKGTCVFPVTENSQHGYKHTWALES